MCILHFPETNDQELINGQLSIKIYIYRCRRRCLISFSEQKKHIMSSVLQVVGILFTMEQVFIESLMF